MPPAGVTVDPNSAAAGDEREGTEARPRASCLALLSTTPARVIMGLLVLLVVVLSLSQAGVFSGSSSSSSGATDATKGGKGGKGKDGKAVPSTKPSRSRRPSPSRPPSASSTSRPLTPCSCAEDDKKKHVVVHILDADNRDALAMGMELLDPQAAYSGIFSFTNVVDVLNHDPVYPTGRTVVLLREDATSGATGNVGNELNQNTAEVLKGLTGEKVPYQKCHLEGNKPPVYFYIDSSADQDAGEWLGESAVYFNDQRWGALNKRHPDIKVLLKSPAPHKAAIFQLLGIPPSRIAYLNPGFPCEGGNRVIFPPFGRNDAPGWSQEWWKVNHMITISEQFRKAAGLPPKCPKTSRLRELKSTKAAAPAKGGKAGTTTKKKAEEGAEEGEEEGAAAGEEAAADAAPAAEEKAAAPAKKAPAGPPPGGANPGGVIYIAMSASDHAKHDAAKAKDKADMEEVVAAMEAAVSEAKGLSLTFPEAMDLDVESGEDTKAFFAAVGTARIIVTYASSSTWMLASVARGATIIVGGTKSSDAKTLKRPGHATEKSFVAKYNAIVELPSDPKKAVEELKKAVSEAKEEKEKKKPPKCKA
jgi:hypothetical protein